MDNKTAVLREYNELLTERNRLVDYLSLNKFNYAAYILIKMDLDDVETEISQVGERLERLNWLDEIIADTPEAKEPASY